MKRMIIIFILAFAFFYLMGSFVEVSFDISHWAPATRGFTAIMGTFFAVICSVGINSYLNDKGE